MTKGGKAKRKGYTLGEVLFGSGGGSSSSKPKPRTSKKQTSRKVHDSKGKPRHQGRKQR